MQESFQIARIILFGTLSFLMAFFLFPLFLHFARKFQLGKNIRDEKSAPIASALHQAKRGTPTMGGVVIWMTVLILAVVFSFADPNLNFLTRKETFLPLGALLASALVGLVDDWFNVKRLGPHGGGLRMRHKLLIYIFIAAVAAFWFYVKLDWDTIHIPFFGDVFLHFWAIPVFLFIIVATSLSVNETDGLDGLAGGVLLSSFLAYGMIAFLQGKYDLAVLASVIVGALFAFLWFNIFPAALIMGDTGAMSLGVALGVIAILSNAPLLLPIVGIIFVVESCSVILQIFWRKVLKKKLFLSSPLHHHLEAKQWPEPKIVMRLWIVSLQFAAVGAALFLLDRYLGVS